MITEILSFLFSWYSYITSILLLISLTLYIIPIIYTKVLPVNNLKDKYKTEWALVTGGSSGIGASLCEKLAKMGLNVVLVALDDQVLEKQHEKLSKQFPERKFLKVGVDLSKDGYVDIIKNHTKDIDIGVVFNNAGFIRIGLFVNSELDKHLGHIECNMMSYMKITHYFYNKWREEGRRGFISLTSSSVSYFISPMSIMYGATKAFVTSFGESLAIEARNHNVDIMTFHPQYTRTRLYDNSFKLKVLEYFHLIGSEPSEVAETMLKCAGRVSMRDQGIYSIFMRIFGGLMFDLNFLIPISSFSMKHSAEYKQLQNKKNF